MKKEEWMPISKYFNRYLVSSEGRVKSVYKNGKEIIMKSYINPGGYKRLQLSGGEFGNVLVHTLVAKAFISNPENKPFVNHKNSIRDDNRVCNLEWVTRSENMLHGFKYGFKTNLGEKNPKSVLTPKDVLEIVNIKESLSKIAKKYGVQISAIHRIKSGQSWSHVTGITYKRKRLKKVGLY
jgi:hypothetical protein